MSDHMSRVRALPCIICEALNMRQSTPTEAHHIRTGVPMGRKAPDECTVPLCREHHTGRSGIHGDRSAWNMARLGEITALGMTIARLTGGVETGETGEPRSLSQNAKLWPGLRDICRQLEWPQIGTDGQVRVARMDEESWKCVMTAGLKQHQRMAAGIEGGWVLLGESTSRMLKRRFSELLTLTKYFGDSKQVKWTDPKWVALVREHEQWLEREAAKQAKLPEAA